MTRDHDFNEPDDIFRLKKHLGGDEDFYPSDDEVERLVARVDASIDAAPAKRIAIPLKRTPLWLGIAASLVLILGASWISYRYGSSIGTTATTDTTSTTANQPLVASVATDDVTLDDVSVSVLLEEISEDYSYDAASRLLDDLTEAEMLYLQETFDVGDLL